MRLIIVLFCLSSFFSYAQELKKYEALYNHWNIEGFLTQFNRNVDSVGIVIQKNEYHALIISFYGIINFHEFEKTGDSLYYQRVVNQYKYFSDSSKLHYFDNGNAVGLPYLFAFNGLKAPWYSGMTQGTAVSYLLRYYKLTQDHTALDLAQKLIRFMLKTEADGGTIGRTKEGLLWIEEYPNCKQSKSVLNGFLNGLIGLKEYLGFFPEDENAKMIHDSCYSALFSTLSEYDTPTWTNYNRNGKTVTNGYMRYQLSEFDQLLNLYGDSRFRDEMMIWSKLAVNKLCKELKFYKNPDFQYAIDLIDEDNRFEFSDSSNFSKSLVNTVDDYSHYIGAKFKKMNLSFNSKQSFTELLFSENFKSDKISVAAFLNGIEQVARVQIGENSISIEGIIPYDSLSVNFSKKIKKSNQLLAVNVFDKYNYLVPFFGVVNIKNKFTLEKGKAYRILFSGNNLSNGKAFYRHADINANLVKQKYKIENSFNLSEFIFTAPENGIYEFFISYSLNLPNSFIADFELIEDF